MAVWSEVTREMITRYSGRIDAEFYRPNLLRADHKIKSGKYTFFGKIIRHGYRVVYENTKILPKDKVNSQSVRFLQATKIYLK